MALTSLSPWVEMETLRERMDRLFSDLNGAPQLALDTERLALDIKETDDAVTVTASVPGFKPEEISVDISNGTLTIRGETKSERDDTQGRWHLHERRTGSVHRVITLPAATSDAEAKATLTDGVLTVSIPKSEQQPIHRIAVEQS